MAKKVAIVNNKGGSTKTTTAVNLAGALSVRYPDSKILIFEGDAQGNASTSFKIDSNRVTPSVYDVFMDGMDVKDVVINAFDNIDIAPANADMNFLEFDEMDLFKEKNKRQMFKLMKMMEDRGVDISALTYESFDDLFENLGVIEYSYFDKINSKINAVDDKYDYIIFDTPPELKSVTSSILSVSDSVIIPFEPEIYAIDGIGNILLRIQSIQEDYNPDIKIAGMLATKVKKNTNLHKEVTKGVMSLCEKNNIKYFDTEISSSIRYADANAYHGVPSTIARPKNEFSLLYYNLLDELIEGGIF